MDYYKKLNSYKYQRITEEELMKLLGLKNNDYFKYVEIVNDLINNEILSGVETLGYNGKDPRMFKKFHIHKEEKDYSETLQEIKKLHFIFDLKYYQKKPEIYLKHRDYILKINNFFINQYSELKNPASLNERSFQIFGEEKLIKDNLIVTTILKNLGFSLKTLNIYKTPEPFFYTIQNRESKNVIIIENKDTWYTIKKILSTSKKNIFGLDIDAAIYGEGWKILDSFIYVEEIDYFKEDLDYYYFGDLDYEGIGIYQELVVKYGNYNIKLFSSPYIKMIDYSNGIVLQKMKNQNKRNIDYFLKSFNNDYKDMIMELLGNRLYIPQEILTHKRIQEGDKNV